MSCVFFPGAVVWGEIADFVVGMCIQRCSKHRLNDGLSTTRPLSISAVGFGKTFDTSSIDHRRGNLRDVANLTLSMHLTLNQIRGIDLQRHITFKQRSCG